jgi:hypothetical protein
MMVSRREENENGHTVVSPSPARTSPSHITYIAFNTYYTILARECNLIAQPVYLLLNTSHKTNY